MKAFCASAKANFLPEMDIHFLADGTPVLIHDRTADRTLRGAKGPIRLLTPTEWHNARIVDPSGGPTAPTLTLKQLLDGLGGKVVLVPEFSPGTTSAEVTSVLNDFDRRNLRNSLLIQTYDWNTAVTIAKRGYSVLYLIRTQHLKQTPQQIRAAGIRWVGPSRHLPRAEITSLIAAGLHVAPYTFGSSAAASRARHGLSGYFVNNPWNK